jgi:hypothetical protein
MMEDNMTESKTETKKKAKIIFEKLTVKEEKKVRGSATPDGICGPQLENCGQGSPPTYSDC